MANTRKGGFRTADRRRSIMIQVGLTAVVVIVAVVLVVYIVTTGKSKETPAANESQAIRVASSKLITQPGSAEPKVVLGMYEDFLCPVCGAFEKRFGTTVTQLIDDGSVAADYYMVAILDRPQNQNYSSRAGGAAYCVADADDTPDKQAFQRFHAALYAQQPSETGSTFPTNDDLIETARQAGAAGDVPDCIGSGEHAALSAGLAEATSIMATPTVRLNGEDYQYTTPEALVAKVKELLG